MASSTAADLAAHRSDWISPISTTYRGYEVFELPPNTQGIVALEMLNILEGFDVKALGHNSAAYLHLLVEAKRIAFADRAAWLGDAVPPDAWRGSSRRSTRRSAAGKSTPRRRRPSYSAMTLGTRPPRRRNRRSQRRHDLPDRRRSQGNVVSLIQSIYENFGAGIVAGDTGHRAAQPRQPVLLQPGHPNLLAPGKRPFHTLVPAMVLKDGRPWLSFGVMGGDMQPQGHVQVLLNLIDFGMNVQEAGEAARFRHSAAGLALESAISAEARTGLGARGHNVITSFGVFGGFQGICSTPNQA